MGMIDRALGFMGYEKRNGAADPSWHAFAPGVGYIAGVSARAAENLSAVLACTNAIATALAYVPAVVYQRDGEGARTEALSHPILNIVRGGVNARMTWPDFIEHLVASTLLTGNGLAEPLRADDGLLIGFRYIPWGSVTVAELSSGRLAYDIFAGKDRTRRLLEGEVFHLRDRTDDGMIGRSRLSRAAETVAGAHAANNHARAFLNNGANPSGVIESPGVLTADQREQLRTLFAEKHEGTRNAGRTLMLDGGLTWKAAQISPEDAELLETRKFGVEEICRLFQVLPPIVQDYSHNTFTNSETAGRWFATFCLAPWARKIEAEFARSVFPANGPFELELDLSGFLRGDPEKRWAAHAIALANKVLDPDEVRQIEGWNPRTAPATAPSEDA